MRVISKRETIEADSHLHYRIPEVSQSFRASSYGGSIHI